jgi:hypothetical protein
VIILFQEYWILYESSNIKSETKFQQFSYYSPFSNIHETSAPINIENQERNIINFDDNIST